VQEGGAHVEVRVAVTVDHQDGQRISRQPDDRDGEHHAGVDGNGMAVSHQRLVHDIDPDARQGERVYDRDDHLETLEAEGIARRGGPLRDALAGIAQHERQDVGEVVPRVGDECEAPGEHPAHELRDGDDGVEYDEGQKFRAP